MFVLIVLALKSEQLVDWLVLPLKGKLRIAKPSPVL